MTNIDWSAWHDAYAEPGSRLADRLAAVRAHIDRRLDDTAPDPVRVVSACAGDGRDLLGVMAQRADAVRVTALLVEYDAGLAARARDAAAALDATVEVRQADAANSDVYAGAVPADLVLLCGIFGNVSDADVRATVMAAPQLCSEGAEVVWTRHRAEPDLTPTIRGWFAEAGFEEVAFEASDDHVWSVGVHRLVAEPQPLEPGRHWFTFDRG
nr:SAM-dependent methyltransferase [Nocardioides ginsengisegetis]